MHSRKTILMAILAGSLLAPMARAQTTNSYYPPPPYTQLEAMEARTGFVIIKATSPIGTVETSAGSVSVTWKEDQYGGGGSKTYGIAIGLTPIRGGLTPTKEPEDVLLLDPGEVDQLLKAIDSLEKMDWSVTTLSNFSASFETRAGFRIIIFSSRRSGAIEFAVRSTHDNASPILLARDQVAQFRSFIEQAQTKLAGLLK